MLRSKILRQDQNIIGRKTQAVKPNNWWLMSELHITKRSSRMKNRSVNTEPIQ